MKTYKPYSLRRMSHGWQLDTPHGRVSLTSWGSMSGPDYYRVGGVKYRNLLHALRAELRLHGADTAQLSMFA